MPRLDIDPKQLGKLKARKKAEDEARKFGNTYQVVEQFRKEVEKAEKAADIAKPSEAEIRNMTDVIPNPMDLFGSDGSLPMFGKPRVLGG